jgi:formate hydrogenlyase transcriptional activator
MVPTYSTEEGHDSYKAALLRNLKEKETLLALSKEISLIKNKMELMPVLRKLMKKNGLYTDLAVSVINEDRTTTSGFFINYKKRRHQHPDYPKEAAAKHPLADGVFDKILQSDGPVIFDFDKITDKPSYIQFMHARGMRHMVAVTLYDSNKAFGFFFMISRTKKVFTRDQLGLIQGIANQVGNAVANIIAYDAAISSEKEKTLLLSLSKDITSSKSKAAIQDILDNKLSSIFQFNAVVVSLLHSNKINHGAYLYSFPEEMMKHPDLEKSSNDPYFIPDGVYEVMLQSERPVIYDLDELMARNFVPGYVDFFYKNGIREMVAFPIRVNDETIGGLWIHAKTKNAFTKQQLNLSEAVCSHIAIAVSNIRAYEKIESQLHEINQYKSKLEEENLYLQEQIKIAYNYSEIVGDSLQMKQVFDLVGKVAAADSTVLLQGETGTGKELVARAIHNCSHRKDRLMVKVNCAALPANLIESELFGHEKGSFTGATERRIGKFELANNSTLFLDEIGELPLELQVKLLRALQEREIERIGGKSTIKVNVRIVAATNRNLQEEMAGGRFRNDLFYRLNVFPINIPPLRERKEDIPLLTHHFVQRLSPKLGKQVVTLSQKVLEQMIQYDWPGNVRELEHMIERSMLMTSGNVIKEIYLPVSEKSRVMNKTEDTTIKTIDENEREHILSILEKSNGRIRGTGGAAELLKIPPTTLHSKMKKLGIRKSGQ